jgi:hypothetical protein
MGIISRLVETFSLGCRSRTLSLEEDKNCYDGHRRSVIPVSQEVGEEDTNCYDGHRRSVIPVSLEVIVAVNEVGEEVIIEIVSKPK